MLNPMERILIVDDERLHLKMLHDMLKDHYTTSVALDGQQALQLARSDPQPDLILLDIQMPLMDGFEVMAQLQSNPATVNIPVIFLTALDAEEDETTGLNRGAVDYITKPFSPAIVNARIKTQLKLRRSIQEKNKAQVQSESLRQQVGALNNSLHSQALRNPQAFSHIMTQSPLMRAVFHYMEAISNSGEPVLITGETGVGKELIAQGLHELTQRSGKLISVNLAGLDDNAVSDTLFGHKKGAFTGANQERKGLISQAAGGTLFLDEIGDLEPASQIKLLRLLQERLYYPLGSDTPVSMDANIVAATHRDLSHLIETGDFRQDLFFRLSVHHIKIPALRERREDIPLMTLHFLEEASQALGQETIIAPPELFQLFATYNFPGNVRELRALVLDAAAQHHFGQILSLNVFRDTIAERRASQTKKPHTPLDPSQTFDNPEANNSQNQKTQFTSAHEQLPTLKEAERNLIAQAMQQANNNQGIAAALLGISRTALNRRLSRIKEDSSLD